MRIVMEDVNLETALKLYGLLCSGHTAQLTGSVNDGRLVNASALQLRAIDEFSVTQDISFGKAKDIPPTQSKYPLTGYFDGALTLIHSGWNIDTIPCANPAAARELAKNWRIPVEGTVLRLRREDATVEQHRDFARIIMILLSIASGTGVSSDRHFFIWDSDELEIWRYWTGDEIGPGPIVPDFEVVRFLEQALPAWQSLTQEQQEALSLARDYINLSALGYMDTRLFRILQPWEFLAKAWGIQGDLSNSEAYLCTELLKTNKTWNKGCPNSDNYGYWGSRIASIFDWPKLRDAVGGLAARFGFNLRQVGLNIDLLKKARDSVAHSGTLPRDPGRSNRQSLDLLTSGQYCLQLLLLRILAYQGKVYHSTGGVRTIVEIDEALTKVRT
jgi:hypothetical protein